MNVTVIFLISQVIWFPFLVGLIRYRALQVNYQPFFWLIVVGVLSEFISYLLMKEFHVASNAVVINIYILCEWFLLAWQFHRWGFLKNKKKLFYILVFGIAAVWVVEDLVFRQLNSFRPYFPFLYSFVVVILSVREINFMITHDNAALYKNPRFLICIGLIIYFIYKIVFEWAYQLSLLEQSNFTARVISFFSYVNLLSNIIFGIAFLLIPKPKKFTLG